MQSKGAIRLVAILIALACAFQLSFTLVTALQERKAASYAQPQPMQLTLQAFIDTAPLS